ncbi:MAG: cation:proton antiporter [Hoylesella saccharolytica]|uniref:cation:proton antiporter n=1 Tax=Hoylesella saccharolytica TaxID=633701 RepID=UPI0028D8AD24|nr:cation:proton antiporter [Hoylesella saccharolytica]
MYSYFPITDPTLIFFIVMLIVLLAPIVMGKLRIPHIIGMVLAGVIVGEYGLNILKRDDSFELFGRVGLYYIMFLAALEMDSSALKRDKYRFIVFGLATFIIPFILIYILGTSILHYSAAASLLLGSLMASNTLIAYPIVGRYGLQRNPSVSLSVGSTMISLFLALVVLAMTVASHNIGSNTSFWLLFILKVVAFCTGMTFFIPRITRWFLRRYSDAVMQFIFIMAVLFMSASLSASIGLEGIFGAFLSGLILNRYVPRLSPLMNRIEFIGNAIFIPYFLIGVGMLINLRLLFQGRGIIWTVMAITVVGTLGKAIAAYVTSWRFKMPHPSGNMMFGLTSAHAAGAIAIVMVGMQLEVSSGQFLMTDNMLNAVVIMILITCIISSVITENAAKTFILNGKNIPADKTLGQDDENILIPVKYPEYANRLISLAVMMRNPKLNRGLIALNLVYDDENMRTNQERGQQLLDQISKYAAATDVRMQTQVRIAANIANGIKHAFNEFHASEIIIGLHSHKEISPKFWGQFHQSLFNGLNRQIIMARLNQPLNTIRRIQVAVPSRAQYEPGFYRWLERLVRVVRNLECRIDFHARQDTLKLINEYIQKHHASIRAEYLIMNHWNELPSLAETIAADHLFVVITARKGTVSYKAALDHLPDEMTQHFSGANLMIIFPDQFGDNGDRLTFAEPQHTEATSAYEAVGNWMRKLKNSSTHPFNN